MVEYVFKKSYPMDYIERCIPDLMHIHMSQNIHHLFFRQIIIDDYYTITFFPVLENDMITSIKFRYHDTYPDNMQIAKERIYENSHTPQAGNCKYARLCKDRKREKKALVEYAKKLETRLEENFWLYIPNDPRL